MKINFKSKFTIVITCSIVIAFLLSAFTAFMIFDASKKQGENTVTGTKNVYNLQANYSDTLTIGDVQSETAHRLEKTGSITAAKTSYQYGLLSGEVNNILFAKKGDSVTFYMNISGYAPDNLSNPIVLEIEEMHSANKMAFGYTVSIDDKPTYFRAYEELLTGKNSAYIQIKRSDITDLKNVKVTITNEGNSEFRISRAFMYADLYGYTKKQNFNTKMGLNLFAGGTKDLSESLKQFQVGYQSFDIGLSMSLPLVRQTDKEFNKTIDQYILAGKTNNMPVSVMPNRWWGGTAFTVDGAGGYFSDLKNNQVLYYPSKGLYRPTTPNQWSSTPWPSMNSPQVVKAGADKSLSLGKVIGNRLAINQAMYPNDIKQMGIHMEWGGGYSADASIFQGGDFSSYVIDAAAKEGITLNPEDGISDQEKAWMYLNVGRYYENLASNYSKGVGSNSIIVDKGTVKYPKYQVSNNIYSHGLEELLYPSFDKRNPLWLTCVSDYNWPSFESYEFTDNRQHDYMRSVGKVALVNVEMTMLTKIFFQDYATRMYGNGVEFLTMFNPKKQEEGQYIKQIDKIEEREVEEETVYNRALYELDFFETQNKGYNKTGYPNVVSMNNLEIVDTGVMTLKDFKQPGDITFKINNTTGSNAGLKLLSEAYARGSSTVKFFVGTSPSNLEELSKFMLGQKMTWFNLCTLYEQDLAKYKDSNEIYVKVVLEGPSKNDVYLRKVRVEVPWEKTPGVLNNEPLLYLQKRIQSLNTQYRVVAERMLEQYLTKIGSENDSYKHALAMYKNAQYFDTYEYLSMVISEALPATFSISGFGNLGEYPIKATLPSENDAAVVTLLKASNNVYEMKFLSDKVQDIKLTVSGLDDKKKYGVTQLGTYHIEIKEDNTGLTPKDGSLDFKVKIAPMPDKIITGTVEGVVRSIGGTDISIEIQDPTVGEYAEGINFVYATNCKFERSQEGSDQVLPTKPKVNDYVKFTLDATGKIISSKALYGQITGTIKQYYKPTLKGPNPPTNGVVELTNGMRFQIAYGRSMTTFDTVSLTGNPREMDIQLLEKAFKPGAVVKIEYIPVAYKDTDRRMISISQDVLELLNEDYEQDGWDSKLWVKKSIKQMPMSKDVATKVLQPSTTNDPGEIVYKFETSKEILEANIIYKGRAIMNEKCWLKFSTSVDGQNWTEVSSLDYTMADSGPYDKARYVDASQYVSNSRVFYLKVQISSNVESWGSLNDLVVRATTK